MELIPSDRSTKTVIWVAVVSAFVYWSCFEQPSPTKLGVLVAVVFAIVKMLQFVYKEWLWSINPIERTPRLASEYRADITFRRKTEAGEESGKKTTTFLVSQTGRFISITSHSEEMTSRTVCSNLVKEDSVLVLYYVYHTDPKLGTADKNPRQNGLCRLVLESEKPKRVWDRLWPKATETLQAQYWTSSHSYGDIKLTAIETNQAS